MFTKIAIWIQSLASLIQACSSIVMMVFSILYVVFTKRLVEQNYNTFLVVTDVKPDPEKGGFITIENHGSSLALNISVSVEMRNAGQSAHDSSWISATGKNMLASGEREIYRLAAFDASSVFNHRISVTYRSQSRRKRTELWLNRENCITYLGS